MNDAQLVSLGQQILTSVEILILIFTMYVMVTVWKQGFNKKRFSYFVLCLGGLFVSYTAYNVSSITPTDWADIMLTLGLLAVTGLASFSAYKQSNASVKMAEEMQTQRYDSERPVIDIQDIEELGRTSSVQLAEAKAKSRGTKITEEREWPKKLTCLLRNIGVGPATDIFSFITITKLSEVGSTEHYEFRRLGPLERGANLTDISSEKWRLFLMQRNSGKCLVTYCFDVYGRCFESIREVIRDETTGELRTNPLKVKEIEDKEYELLIKGNYKDFVDKLWPTLKSEVP
jgi:hypothetical protein